MTPPILEKAVLLLPLGKGLCLCISTTSEVELKKNITPSPEIYSQALGSKISVTILRHRAFSRANFV